MSETLDRIEEDVFEASNDGQMPYITLQAFRLGIEAVRQLTRIADALQRPAPPDLRTLTANSLPDVPHRNEVSEWRDVRGCTMKDGVVDCLNCPGLPTCIYADRGAIESAQAEAANREMSEVSELHDCTVDYPGCIGCPNLAMRIHTDVRPEVKP